MNVGPAPASAADRRAAIAIAVIALGAVAIRLALLGAPGFLTDVSTFEAWARRLAEVGPWGFYEPGYFSDYPPGFLYVLWPLGALLDGEALRLAIKAITIPFDLGIAGVVVGLLWRRAGRTAATLAAALWLLAPGVIFAGPYWGQVDAVGTLPLLASLLAAGRRRWLLAGVLGAIAAMVKPQFGLGLLVVLAAATIEYVRANDKKPMGRVVLSAAAIVLAIGLPFRAGPFELLGIVRSASETYPYTSLFAFNGWSIVGDFWKPDDRFVVIGAALLVLGLAAACAPLWWRRDTEMLLACGAFVVFAFYFLPTRAHERYLFPAFALLLPFAATRGRVLAPYAVLAAGFFLSMVYVFTQYQFIDPPGLFQAALYPRPGQIALAAVMIGSAALLVWRLVRGEDARELEPDIATTVPSRARIGRWELPAGLLPGRAPTRRDYVVALLVALAVLATRGYRLDQPRDMYFDEVYHARTAFELLAQREPYEWTHPHLAKEIMALGILAFGDDRIVGHEQAPADITAFAVGNDGTRVYGDSVGRLFVAERGSPARLLFSGLPPALALSVDGGRVVGINKDELFDLNISRPDTRHLRPLRAAAAAPDPVTAFAVVGDRAVIGTPGAVEIYEIGSEASPLRLPISVVAIAAGPQSTDIYVADPAGSIHIVDTNSGHEFGLMSGGGPIAAISYARGPDRVFTGRPEEAALDWYECSPLPEHTRRRCDPPTAADTSGPTYGGTVPLSNERTGEFRTGISALALIPRTQFLYALADGRLVVAETHGASPYAAIPTTATRLGVDGTGDALLLQGDGGVDLVETGRHALAWRLPGVVFGAILAFFLVLLARRLFASPLVAAFAGALVLLDGSMFAQPRIGMNDVYAGAFLVAAWYFVVAAHAPRRSAAVDLLAAGALFGLALASKWVAAYAIAALALLSIAVTVRAFERGRRGEGGPLDLLKGRGLNTAFLLACFAVVPIAIYLLSYRSWFGGPMAPFGWDLVELTKQMYWYHSGLASAHPAGSPWWSWPFVLKPVYWYYAASDDGGSAVIYDAGNVVIFWAALAATVWCAIAAIRTRSVSLGFVVFALLAQLVSWIPITRVLFFYHFFTALPYYLLALAAALVALWERGRQRLVAGYLVVAGLAFIFFYPFVSGQPVPADETGIFFILPTWQYGCQFYPSFSCDLSGTSRLEPAAVLARVGIPLALGLLALALPRLPLDQIWARARSGGSLRRRAKGRDD